MPVLVTHCSIHWIWPLCLGITICRCFPNENSDGVLKGEQSEAEHGHLFVFFSTWTDPLTGWCLANKRLVCRKCHIIAGNSLKAVSVDLLLCLQSLHLSSKRFKPVITLHDKHTTHWAIW